MAKYGRTHCIISSKVDARTLTFGTRGQIRREVDETLALAERCAGFLFAVGNHMPANIPIENALYYMDYLRENWGR